MAATKGRGKKAAAAAPADSAPADTAPAAPAGDSAEATKG